MKKSTTISAADFELADRLLKGYLKTIHATCGDTIDMLIVVASAVKLLHESMEFMTRKTDNYDTLLAAMTSLLHELHAQRAIQTSKLN